MPDNSKAKKKKKYIHLALPQPLVDKIDALAEAENRSRTNTILVLLKGAVEQDSRIACS